jgi:signal transduction histidine kinase
LQKGITIINEIHGTQKIYADEKMINSVLKNLLSNAVKFARKGGKVVGKAREIEEGMVEISVADTGVGIPSDIIGKLFKLGEKVGSKGTDNELSIGLGLVLCKEFVEKNGGRIWVESKEGKGSTFGFTLKKTEKP